MPQGSRGRIGIKKEITWGERNGEGDNDVFLPFVSEGLTTDIEKLMSAAQRGILDEPKSYQGERSFGGPLVIEVHPVSIGHILRSALNVPTGGGLAGTVETVLEPCEVKWTGHTGVISSVDSNDKKKGSYSLKLQVTSGVGNGDVILASAVVDHVDMHLDTAIKFWIKSNVVTAAGDLIIRVSENALGAIADEAYEDMNVPILVADVWQECTVAIDTPGDLADVISVAIVQHTDKGELTIRLDDVRRVVEGDAVAAKQHIFTPRQADDFHADCPINPYTLEVYPDQGKAFQFVGGIVNTLALNFSTTDKILKATCGIIAKNASLQTKIGALGLESTKPFVWENATILVGGGPPASGAMNDMESFSLNWDNKCVPRYTLNADNIPRKIIRSGFREIPVSFTIDFVDKTEYNKFIAGDEQAFQIKFVGAIIDGETTVKYTLQIDLPLVRYLTYPINMGGPGPIVCAVTGEAKYHSDGYPLRATLINEKGASEYAA